MDFEIWKVNHGSQDGLTRYTYSLRQGPDSIPVVLGLDVFKRLFPGIDPESVPTAPATGLARIKTRLVEPIKDI
jgi:hypothetical protein